MRFVFLSYVSHAMHDALRRSEQDLLRSPLPPPAVAAATTCIASPTSSRIPLGRPVIKSPNAPTPSRVGFSAMVSDCASICVYLYSLAVQKQHEELDAAAAVSALQWAAATVACARTGYPKVEACQDPLTFYCLTFLQPGDIPVPPIIRKLQLQSATLAAAASISAHDGREQDIGTAAGDRRPPSALFFERYLRVRGHAAPQSTVFCWFLLHDHTASRPKKRSA